MKRTINTTVTFEDKSFKNDNGETVEYLSVMAKIAGEDVRLSVKKEDKSLLEFLLKRVPAEVK